MPSMFFRTFYLSVLAALLLTPTALAQTAGQGQQAPQQAPAAVDVSEAQLEAVAKAYVSVNNLLAEYEQKLSGVQEVEEAQQIQQQLAVEANEAIEAEGITPQLYDTVLRTAEVDEDLRGRLIAHIEDLVNDTGA